MGLLALLGFGDKKRKSRTLTPEEQAARDAGRRPRVPGSPTLGTAVPRGTEPKTPAEKVAGTNPPDPTKLESENVGAASSAAVRTRRRARAGHAGRVTAPGGTGAREGSTPRSLLGY